MKYDLNDICNLLAVVLNNPAVGLVQSTAIDYIGVNHPKTAVAMELGDKLLYVFRNYKLELLIRGLSTGFNREKRLNDLYNYISNNKENAVNVANVLRKTIAAECPKVCVIFGLILARHIDNRTSFTQQELIVCRALENATEFDLNNFKEIMEKHITSESGKNEINFPEELGRTADFEMTRDWGVHNRIFSSETTWKIKEDDGNLYYHLHHYATESAYVLMNYIKEAGQVWDYQDSPVSGE